VMADVRPVVAAIKDNTFIKFGDQPYTLSQYEGEVQQHKVAIQQDELKRQQDKAEASDQFDKRAAQDGKAISALYMKLPPGMTCVAADVPDEIKDQLLDASKSPFADLGSLKTHFVVKGDANTIFLALKQHACYAVIGTTTMLHDDLIPPLHRDGVVFDYHTGEIPNMAPVAAIPTPTLR